MWTYEHSVDTQASSASVFALFKDVATWPSWNAGVLRIDVNGPFVAGTTGAMLMPGQGPMPFRLTWVEEGLGFEDETVVPDSDIVVHVRHSVVSSNAGGARITYRCVIDGRDADAVGPSLGPIITGDFPEVMEALAARAEQATAGT